MQYCCVLGIRGYQLLTYWEAQTVLRLMGMLDSFNWRQTYDAHTCLSGKGLLHQQKSPLRRLWKVAGAVACALRNFCGRGGNRQSEEHGSTHFPSGRVVVGVGASPRALGVWSSLLKETELICSAQKQTGLHRWDVWLSVLPPSHGNKSKSSESSEDCVQSKCDNICCFLHCTPENFQCFQWFTP